jgi:hypothetical protein
MANHIPKFGFFKRFLCFSLQFAMARLEEELALKSERESYEARTNFRSHARHYLDDVRGRLVIRPWPRALSVGALRRDWSWRPGERLRA